MCVYSWIMEHFEPLIPPAQPLTPWPFPSPTVPNVPAVPSGPSELEKTLRDFRKAEEAAKLIDELTGQPDCTDPEKAKLVERVAQLEKELAKLKKRKKSKRRSKRSASRG